MEITRPSFVAILSFCSYHPSHTSHSTQAEHHQWLQTSSATVILLRLLLASSLSLFHPISCFFFLLLKKVVHRSLFLLTCFTLKRVRVALSYEHCNTTIPFLQAAQSMSSTGNSLEEYASWSFRHPRRVDLAACALGLRLYLVFQFQQLSKTFLLCLHSFKRPRKPATFVDMILK